jgi:histidine triad (HIT) family protein
MENCLFCKIAAGTIPSDKVYEDEQVIAFKDIDPAAPVHILVIPKNHIDGADALDSSHSDLIARLMLTVGKIAKDLQLSKGWRIVTNVLDDGGQTVRHLHLHLLGGGKLGDFGSRHEFRNN